ncbi:MAG TPA: hypothetical protein VFE31_10650 [Opitutaceae bacterium]|jgi:hypothetical protein|nr:hypothetical protein [Opitutaceae bacterium]
MDLSSVPSPLADSTETLPQLQSQLSDLEQQADTPAGAAQPQLAQEILQLRQQITLTERAGRRSEREQRAEEKPAPSGPPAPPGTGTYLNDHA